MSIHELEKEMDKIREENGELLKHFEKVLEEDELGKKTVNQHVRNCDFFINEFLLYQEAIPAHEGFSYINMFLGHWFIKKAMWATPAAIKENAASLKKFYTFLHSIGKIKEQDLKRVKETVKEELPEWIATMKRYDDPNITSMEEVWGF